VPPLWSPYGSGVASNPGIGPTSGFQGPLSFNDIGTQAMPLMQQTYTPVAPVARSAGVGPNAQFQTDTTPGRPYSDVGKMAFSLSDPGVMGQSAVNAQGLFQGFGSGAGRLLGGLIGQGQAGADIGGAIGSIPQAGLNLAANALGSIPALPGLSIPGGLFMSDAEKKAALADAGGNPFTLFRLVGGLNKADWQAKVQSGEINPLLAGIGGADTLGDQIANLLGIGGLGSKAVERTVAGGLFGGKAQDTINRIMDAPMDSLSPEVQAIRQQYADKKLTNDQFLDQLTATGAGYSNNWVANLVGEIALDPMNLLMGAGTAIGLANKTAKAAEGLAFANELGGLDSVAAKTLQKGAADRILQTTGEAINPDHITPLQMADEARASGQYASELQAAHSGLDVQTKVALHPGFAAMEPVADFAQKVLNPLSMIGGGPKVLENAYLSREGTKGVAQHFNLSNWNAVSERMGSLGKGDLWQRAMGYFTAQEGVLMAGDALKQDVQKTRNIMEARPTQIALTRAKVGTTSYAAQMERWLSKRSADLGRLTGGTKAEALARAETTAQDKLTRMGLSAEEAVGVTKGLDEDGFNLIDAMYFGHRIDTYNTAMRAARDAISAKISSGVGTNAAHALQRTVDRLTLIGPRELTYQRAQTLREALTEFEKTGSEDALTSIRNATRQYDRLAYQFNADGTTGEVLASGLKDWLDEHEAQLTKEFDPAKVADMPGEIITDATRGDGYLYGLRPENGAAEWRATFDEAGNIKTVNPWIDIVGDAAQPWNLRFQGDGRVMDFASAIERSMRFMGQQITSDRIDREARRAFIDRGMGRYVSAAEGRVEGGLTYGEAKSLYDAVKTRALDASTSPRGLMVTEFNDVIKESEAAQRVGMTGADLQLLSLQAFEGNVGTVGLTQKLSGRIKTVGNALPLVPDNSLGVLAERIYPLVRFRANPFFQLQEWVEPWIFSWARGEPARMAEGWVDPITGLKVTLDQADLVQQNLIKRYRASNPAEQFDMMERSLTYMAGQKAAKEAAASADQAVYQRALARIRSEGTHARKEAASSRMFRYFLGPNLKEQFDRINPNIWTGLEQEFGTRDKGQIAMRWMVEKDAWASADPRIAYHLMDITKEARYGARAAVDLESNAKVVFKVPREALNMRVKNGTLTYTGFRDAMDEVGAHPDYIDRAWKATQFEVKTGGVDQFYEDAVPLAKGGAREVKSVRQIVQALAETAGISETELLSRTLAQSPVSLLHDDLINASESDLAAWSTLLQSGQNMVANYYKVDPVTGGVMVNPMFQHEAEAEFLKSVANVPSFIPPEQVGNVANMERVGFRDPLGAGRDVFIPGGLKALADRETPWTAWEAHVIRAQVLNPNDMFNNELKAALDEKMWRGHMFDMTDESNLHKVFNNYVFAMHSAQMSLTRNELVASRFRAQSMEDVAHLAGKARAYRSIIEPVTGKEAEAGELGLAYSTEHDVAHYIPLDERNRYYHDGMLPERTTTVREKGVLRQVNVKSTQSLIEQRAQVAKHYLEDTTKEQRAQHTALDKLQDEHRATLVGDAKTKYTPPDRLEHWAIDQLTAAVNGPEGINAIDSLPEFLGIKRAAKFKEDEMLAVGAAAKKLAADPLDLDARNVLRPFVTKMKGHDQNIIFKDWNVNGAGKPFVRGVDGNIEGHGDKELFAYLKNDDVAWRSTGTNTNIGQTLMMAENMRADPQFYLRRSGPEFAPTKGAPVPGYTVSYAEDPLQFPYGELGKGDQATLRASDTGINDLRGITAHDADGKPVGFVYAKYDPDTNTLHVSQSQVLDPHGRKGLGNWMYHQLEENTGATIMPVRDQSETARALWAQPDRPFGPPTRSLREFKTANERGTLVPQGEVRMVNPSELTQTDRLPERGEVWDAYGYLEAADVAQGVREPIKITPDGRIIDGNDRRMAAMNANIDVPVQVMGWPQAQHGLEPLDQYGERISHRTQGLRLKTGFFGTDLGNPLEFNKGVHDIHMVGDLTEWMYDRTAKGTTKEWTDWLGSLSDEKQTLINKWIGKGAPHGAGTFKWKEATGVPISFIPGKVDRARLADASVQEKAAWVRGRIEKAITNEKSDFGPEQRDRLYQMYRNDGELADLVDRDIHTFGGDYKVFEDTMSRRKALAAVDDPSLNRHGNGGYQWKLWDERRHVWDPETTAFNSTHGMDRRGVRYMASSDDAHNLAGFYNELGQPSVEDAGYSYLDPVHTVLTQKNANVVRGATISLDTGEKIIGFTKYRNQTTFLHEMTHGVLEPLLDQSGKQVFIDDLNRVIDEHNADIVPGGVRYEGARQAVEDAANEVNARTSAAAEAKAALVAGRTAKEAPEVIANLKSTFDAATKDMAAANKAHTAATDAFNAVATTPLRAIKTGWDRELSEHVADEFGRWVATGKATNPKMRDAFAYFRNVLLRVKDWLSGQPGQKVSPEVQALFEKLTTPQTAEQAMMSHALPFDATQEMMHAGAIQSVVNAEDAAFTNVQFRRSRSWLERSLNHPYFGIYPASYMWGKVAPEMIRSLAHNPFGLPIPILSKPVKIGAHEYGLHGSPFYGFINAQRVWNSVQMQRTSDPSMDAAINDKKNQALWMNFNMLLPATPWDIPANFPLWSRRIAEFGLNAEDKAAVGEQAPAFDLAKTASDVGTYAFGLGQSLKTLSSFSKALGAPVLGGEPSGASTGPGAITPQMLMQPGPNNASLQQDLSGAQSQLQESLSIK
jgi:hypothetical protein